MKKLFTFLFATMFASQAWAAAGHYSIYDKEIDGITYTLHVWVGSNFPVGHYQEHENTANVKSGCGNSDNVIIHDTVSNIPVSKISKKAFKDCSMTSITIPKTVKTIGDSAFFNCTSLTSITIASSVTSIGKDAFYGCSDNLTIYITKDGIKYKVLEDNSIEVVANDPPYSGVVVIPASVSMGGQSYTVTSISDDAFTGCNGVEITLSIDCSIIINGIKYKVLNENSVEVVSNTPQYTGEVDIPQSVSIGGKNYAVTSIGEEAFYSCKNLTSVTIPESVTSIGQYAFYGCNNLKSATIPSSVTTIGDNAFTGCSSEFTTYITDNGIKYKVLNNSRVAVVANSYSGSVVIPASVSMGGNTYTVTNIGNYAFNGCSELTSVTIPSSVTTISDDAFTGCIGFITFITDNGIKYKVLEDNSSVAVVANLYSGSVVIPRSVSMGGNPYTVISIDKTAFYGRSGLTSVTIPNSVTKIDDYTFAGCSGLTSVTIPNSVTSIGKYAFNGCRGLTSVTIPNSVTSIGSVAFSGCSGLTSITIPISVTSIGVNAFSGCSSDLTTYITDNVIKYKVLDNSSVEVVENTPKYSSATIDIPQTVTIDKEYTVIAIGENAFNGCRGLTSVTIPNTVTTIGESAFYKCSNLKSATIPNSVTTIGDNAFSGCSRLTIVPIPNSLTSIGTNAFTGCSIIVSGIRYKVLDDTSVAVVEDEANSYSGTVEIPPTVTITIDKDYTVKAIGENAFNGCSELTSVTISNSVTTIGDNAFKNCNSLATIDIPNSVTTIGENAFALQQEFAAFRTLTYNTNYIGTHFAGCKFLSIVNMGKSVTTFNIESFVNCQAMESFNVDDDNTEYSSVDGVLYNKDKTILIYCPALKKGNFTLPKTVTSIAEGALQEAGMTYSTSGGALYLGDTKNPYQFLVSVKSPDISTCSIEPDCKYIVGNAFNGCSKLAWVSIPESVTGIGDNAFANCQAVLYCEAESRPAGWSSNANIGTTIMGVKLNKNGYFYSPTNNQIRGYVGSNKIIEIPHEIDGTTITGIGAKAFSNCPDLQAVTIPATITSIDKTAFSGCNNITALTCYTDSLGKCFAGSRSLKTVTIGNDVTTITDGAFEDCSNLRTVNIGVLVKSIGNRAFANCSELRDLTIVSSALSTIGKESFRGCYKIKTITVPDGVSAIGKDAFHYVKNVAYHGTATGSPWGALTINGFREGDFIYLDDKKEKITAYIGDGSEVEIPQTVENIGLMSFFESDNLKKVTIPDNSVVIINESAFGNCHNLEYINIPQSVAIIGYGAFRECYAVKIYCEVTSQPAMWNENWNYRITEDQIVWGSSTAVSESAATANIYAYGSTIVVENATNEIRVYDAMGRLICRDAINRVRSEIRVNTPGIYIVKVGNIAKRVTIND